MDIIRAIVLGVVQAFTEFLPISSSAHLILFRDWVGFDSIDGLTFDVALHLGTVLALIAYFRRDLTELSRSFFASVRKPDLAGRPEQRLVWYIILATIPAAVAGVLLGDSIEAVLRTPPVIVATLIAGGMLFIAVEKLAKPRGGMDGITLRVALLIGVAQSVALVPGVSRSGITIVTGMLQDLRREEAARFSFLLSVPIMLGAGAKKALDLQNLTLDTTDWIILAAGTLSSALVGWFVIRYLLRFLQNHSLDVFAYYRFALAAVVLASLVL